jgi:CRISPR-associated protein Csd1
MILQSLCEYAKRNDLVKDPAFERMPVHFIITIGEKGKYLGLTDQRTEEMPRGKKPGAKEWMVPRPAGSRADITGKVVSFLCETLERVLPGSSEGKDQKKHKTFIELIRQAATQTNDERLKDLVAFLDMLDSDHALQSEISMRLDELKAPPRSLISFSHIADSGQPIFCREAPRHFWRAYYAKKINERLKGSIEGQCIVCGEVKAIAPTHPELIIPGARSRPSLVSFNEAAFCSYGFVKALNSPTCQECVDAYREGFMALARDERTHLRIPGDVHFIFWTRDPVPELNLAALFEQANPDEVKRLLEAPLRGHDRATAESNAFYALTFSINMKRLVVRGWLESTVASVQNNVASWFRDLEIVLYRNQWRNGAKGLRKTGDVALPPRLYDLCLAVFPKRGKKEEAPPRLIPSLLLCALRGDPLPASLLSSAVYRVKVGQDLKAVGSDGGRMRMDPEDMGKIEKGLEKFTPARMGLIRMILNRQYLKGGKPMSPSLDTTRAEPAYLLGRLLAVLARAQEAAIPGAGATVVDRFYGSASTAPASVFSRLLKLGRAHLSKIENRGLAINLEKEIEQIANGLDHFPPLLTLEEQGLFALGFYHQRAAFYTPKHKKEEEE